MFKEKYEKKDITTEHLPKDNNIEFSVIHIMNFYKCYTYVKSISFSRREKIFFRKQFKNKIMNKTIFFEF